MIYFVKPRDAAGPIKIGYSYDPVKRFGSLSTGSPIALELLGVMEGTRATERDLHQRFRRHRMHGEWFRPTRALLNVVSRSSPIDCSSGYAEPAAFDAFVKRAVEQRWTVAEVCQHAGVNYSSVMRKSRKLKSTVRRLERALDLMGKWHG